MFNVVYVLVLLVVALRQAGSSYLVGLFVCDNVGDRQCRWPGVRSFDVVEQSGDEVPWPLPLSSGCAAYFTL